MKKTRSFLLTAGIALAMAFTFSCSDDKDDGNGGGAIVPPPVLDGDVQTYTIPDVQVYQVGEDGGVLYTGQCRVTLMDGAEIGKIDDSGKLSLNLKKISSFDNPQGYERVDFRCGYSSLNLIGTSGDISNVKGKDDIKSFAYFFYASKGGTFEDIDAGALKLKEGWNFVYRVLREGLYTTTQPSNLTWYWIYGG